MSILNGISYYPSKMQTHLQLHFDDETETFLLPRSGKLNSFNDE